MDFLRSRTSVRAVALGTVAVGVVLALWHVAVAVVLALWHVVAPLSGLPMRAATGLFLVGCVAMGVAFFVRRKPSALVVRDGAFVAPADDLYLAFMGSI